MWHVRQHKKRLDELEERFIPKPLIVLCVDADGNEHTMPMREMLDKGYGFAKVISGNNYDDLDAYLQSVQRYAEQKCTEWNNLDGGNEDNE